MEVKRRLVSAITASSISARCLELENLLSQTRWDSKEEYREFREFFPQFMVSLFGFDEKRGGWLERVSTAVDVTDFNALLSLLSPSGRLFNLLLKLSAFDSVNYVFPISLLSTITRKAMLTSDWGSLNPFFRAKIAQYMQAQRNAAAQGPSAVSSPPSSSFLQSQQQQGFYYGSAGTSDADLQQKVPDFITLNIVEYFFCCFAYFAVYYGRSNLFQNFRITEGGVTVNASKNIYLEILQAYLDYFLPLPATTPASASSSSSSSSSTSSSYSSSSYLPFSGGSLRSSSAIGHNFLQICLDFWLSQNLPLPPTPSHPQKSSSMPLSPSQQFGGLTSSPSLAHSSSLLQINEYFEKSEYIPPTPVAMHAAVRAVQHSICYLHYAHLNASAAAPVVSPPSALRGLSSSVPGKAPGLALYSLYSANPSAPPSLAGFSIGSPVLSLSTILHTLRKPAYLFLKSAFQRWPLETSTPFTLVVELWLSYIQPWSAANRTLLHESSFPGVARPDKAPSYSQQWLVFVETNFLFYSTLLEEFFGLSLELNYMPPESKSVDPDINIIAKMADVFRGDLYRAVLECEQTQILPHLQQLKISNLAYQPQAMSAMNLSVRRAEIWNHCVSLAGPSFPYLSLKAPETQTSVKQLISIMKSQANVVGGKVDVSMKKDIDALMENVIKVLCEMFDIAPDSLTGTETPKLTQPEKPPVDVLSRLYSPDMEGSHLTSIGRQQLKKGIRMCSPMDVRYIGDDSLRPITTAEIAWLVRLLHKLSVSIHNNPTAKQYLQSIGVTKLNLRPLASYFVLMCIAVGMLFLYLLILIMF